MPSGTTVLMICILHGNALGENYFALIWISHMQFYPARRQEGLSLPDIYCQ